MCAGEPPPIAARRSRGMRGRVPIIALKYRNWPTIAVQPALVVDEEALAPRRAAGRHGAVAAEVELVAAQALDVREQRVAAQAPVGDDVVEVLHHRRLVQRRQRADADRPGRSRPAPRGSTASAAPRGAPARSTARAGAPRGARPASVHARPARGRAAARCAIDRQSPDWPASSSAPLTSSSSTSRAMRVPRSRVDHVGADEPLERQSERHRDHRHVDLARVDARAASRGRRRGARAPRRTVAPAARGWSRSARAARGAGSRAPRTRRTSTASGRRARAGVLVSAITDSIQPAGSCGRGERPLELGDRPLHASLVDGEEEVLLGREVRVHRALRVAGRLRDLVDRRRMEAALHEEPVGGREHLLARAARCCSARVIRIPLVFVYQRYLKCK